MTVWNGRITGRRVLRPAIIAAAIASSAIGASAASAQTHYCSGLLNGTAACQSSRNYVSYNEVDASADAVCEALSNASPPPNPVVGVLYTAEDCISTGATSAGAHYSASLPALFPWIGNRHSYQVTVYTATHFDIWI